MLAEEPQIGYIMVPRDFFMGEDWIAKRKLSKAEAWIWLVANARFSETPQKVVIKGVEITQNRGQLIYSLDGLARAWGWQKTAVQRYLKAIRDRYEIDTEVCTVVTRITICKYDSYSGSRYATDTKKIRKRYDSVSYTNKENKEIRKEGKDSVAFVLPSDYETASKEKQEGYLRWKAMVEQKYPVVIGMKMPLVETLMELGRKYGADVLESKLAYMQNKPVSIKGFTDLGLTLQSWTRKEKTLKEIEEEKHINSRS